ncbi:hypothetical protein ACTHPH_21900 [Paenibacillus pasadenensis]|uniref:hypothetical protein n=1 Tax=Paenibacillus pasadenensis TaxID=217090 RepID=UPI0003F8FAF7|nr:hypothetical protein [Paenibacillus pasadenensis]
MAKHLSVGQRIKKAGTLARQEEIALAWAEDWQAEYDRLIRSLEAAVRHNDYDQLCRMTGQLKAVGQKKFSALPGVIRALAVE